MMMKLFFALLTAVLTFGQLNAQTNTYNISFKNAVHHEADIRGTFPEVTTDTLTVRMSRTSPGRYALHEFAKNVYDFKAMDGKGNSLEVIRPSPYAWQVVGHDGTVTISYTLFANRGDGTYSQIDETHAHLNIPATFIYAPAYRNREILIDFDLREDLYWKVATQLPLVSGTRHSAPNLDYFMDSPTEISNHHVREFEVNAAERKQTIQLVLHHNGSQQETDAYFEKVKKVVLAEKAVYGTLPDFDYARYTFIACYIPNATGDGMEHRNSTILTSTRSLAEGGMERNIGTVSHEFFHAWNVERIRPKALEPFNFEAANMSGELWFAEGFTSYYTNLILCRAGLITPENYVEGLTGTFNYVWNSPARKYFNPIQMSFQAPFVDAATTVDPVNRENTFISYYSYGAMLGLALDLSLRQNQLNLDAYMQLVWQTYGKTETPYTLKDLQELLGAYAGKDFGDNFFNSYIHTSGMPDYSELFDAVGVVLSRHTQRPHFGASAAITDDLNGVIRGNPAKGSPAYTAGLDKGDRITSINGMPFPNGTSFSSYIEETFQVGDSVPIDFNRFGIKKSTVVVLDPDPAYRIQLIEKEGAKPAAKELKRRNMWLGTE